MGQPILGDIDNINNVTKDMVKEYHATHYIEKNLIIVGTGNINQKEFVDMEAKKFGNMK
jgi:predicted Zn-dependent peptidase